MTGQIAGRVASALAGAVVGGALMLAAGALTEPPRPAAPARDDDRLASLLPTRGARAPQVSPKTKPAPVRSSSRVLLAWFPDGRPARLESALEALPGIEEVAVVRAGLDWLRWARTLDGEVLDRAAGGYLVPFETAVIEPGEYARFVPPGERDAILALEPGEVLLAETSAELRGGGEGLRLHLLDRALDVSGVVGDVSANGYEGLVAGAPPRSWTRADDVVLVQLRGARARRAAQRRIHDMVGSSPVRIRSEGATPFLRYGDGVLPQMLIKDTFGEFHARPLPDGTLDIEPGWRARNIIAARVPLLGRVVCHRTFIPQFRRAMRAVLEAGLAHTVAPGFGGCYSPRFVNRDPGGRLSHHSWGIAVDLNVGANPFGTKPDMDERLVRVLESHGLTWGGRWIVPDGMHFEWVRFP